MSQKTTEILKQRGSVHGSFMCNAYMAQEFKNVLRQRRVDAIKQEALEMILHKIARIMCGDPDNIDSWQDIIGYATLVIEDLKKKGYIDTKVEYVRVSGTEQDTKISQK